MNCSDTLINFQTDDTVDKVPTKEEVMGKGYAPLSEDLRSMLNINNMERRSDNKPIIKVVGVGGGGGNAVNHMYLEGIKNVSFVVCNTDLAALKKMAVPMHMQLGTDGLGAGNICERGRQKAEESVEEIRQMLNDGTKMVFITAGMGGGTGTGAAPIVAREASELGILTVAIVTLPFLGEGNSKIMQALGGLEEMKKYVDAMIVVNNQRLAEHYKDYECLSAYECVDDILCNAAKSIIDLIYVDGRVNVDFRDVNEVLTKGRVAVISTGYAEGVGRVSKAIEDALSSPLLDFNDVFKSRKVLVNVSYSQKDAPLMMSEQNEVTDFMNGFQDMTWAKFGLAPECEELGKQVKVTLLVSGLGDIENATQDGDFLNSTHERELFQTYYGTIRQNGRNNYYYYVFNAKSMDDETIIAKVAETPTYNRKAETLNIIREMEKREN